METKKWVQGYLWILTMCAFSKKLITITKNGLSYMQVIQTKIQEEKEPLLKADKENYYFLSQLLMFIIHQLISKKKHTSSLVS